MTTEHNRPEQKVPLQRHVNLLAADVRRLKLRPVKELRASLRRPLQLKPIAAEDMLRAEVRVFQNAESSGFTTRAAPNHRSIRRCSGAREANGINCPSGPHPDLRDSGCVV